MRENMQTIKLVAGGKVANERNISMFTVFPLLRWTEKYFLFGIYHKSTLPNYYV